MAPEGVQRPFLLRKTTEIRPRWYDLMQHFEPESSQSAPQAFEGNMQRLEVSLYGQSHRPQVEQNDSSRCQLCLRTLSSTLRR